MFCVSIERSDKITEEDERLSVLVAIARNAGELIDWQSLEEKPKPFFDPTTLYERFIILFYMRQRGFVIVY
jgi:hypothetical protein